MNALLALVAVVILVVVAAVGAQVAGLRILFTTILPYAAILLFLGGMIHRVLKWARAPVPFRIPTTCGQQKTLDWIPSSRLDNPHDTIGVWGRMALEVLFFRSLFRNTKMELKENGRLVYGPNKWLWLFGLVFHYSFLVVFIRHLRFFTEPVPGFVTMLQGIDGFFEIGVPVFYVTSMALLAGVAFLFLRRVTSPQLTQAAASGLENERLMSRDAFSMLLITKKLSDISRTRRSHTTSKSSSRTTSFAGSIGSNGVTSVLTALGARGAVAHATRLIEPTVAMIESRIENRTPTSKRTTGGIGCPWDLPAWQVAPVLRKVAIVRTGWKNRATAHPTVPSRTGPASRPIMSPPESPRYRSASL
jgi:nitrate reductase gamma subunit